MKNKIALGGAVVTVAIAGIPAEFAHSQSAEHTFIVTPKSASKLGLDYAAIAAALAQFRPLVKDEPVQVFVNEKTNFVDLSTFDDLVVRVPLGEAMAQPNRFGAEK